MLVLLLVALAQPTAAPALEGLPAVITEEQARQKDETESQARVDALADETDALLAEYRSVLDQADDLRAYNGQLAAMVATQEARLASFDARLAQAEDTQRDVTPLLERMFGELSRFVAADLPFAERERGERLASLRRTLDDPAQPIGERFRRVLEAGQVEMEYGRTLEAWRDTVLLEDGEHLVDLLRVGRLGLYLATLDGTRGARWDTRSSRWQRLDASALPQLLQALRIARKEMPPELLVLPVVHP